MAVGPFRGGWVALVLALWLAGGCASYSGSFSSIERELAARQPDKALALLEKRPFWERDSLLFALDRGMLLQMKGDYRASNGAFEEAKGVVASVSALSLREQAQSLLVNDAFRSYEGEPYEQVLLHIGAMVNYLALGETGAARVEALQVDLRLRELADRHSTPLFQTDGFARYMTGVVYEAHGELDDALIAYRKAHEAYQAHQEYYPFPIPEQLKRDLLRLTRELGRKEEYRRYRQLFDDVAEEVDGSETGEVIFLLHNGLAPMKREKSIMEMIPKSQQLVRVSLPYYLEEADHRAHRARVVVGEASAVSEPVEDVRAIAKATLAEHTPAIVARAVARAMAKHELSRKAKKENAVAGMVTNLAGVLTEVADTRSWMSLPSEYQLARLRLPPGHYSATVEWLGPEDRLLARHDAVSIEVKARQKTFLTDYWIPPTTRSRPQ